jgi:hypothetical protein
MRPGDDLNIDEAYTYRRSYPAEKNGLVQKTFEKRSSEIRNAASSPDAAYGTSIQVLSYMCTLERLSVQHPYDVVRIEKDDGSAIIVRVEKDGKDIEFVFAATSEPFAGMVVFAVS